MAGITSGGNEFERGLWASIRSFARAILQAFGDDLVIDMNEAVFIQLVHLGADFRAHAIATACGLVDDYLEFALTGHPNLRHNYCV
jgi:hypothetical protein